MNWRNVSTGFQWRPFLSSLVSNSIFLRIYKIALDIRDSFPPRAIVGKYKRRWIHRNHQNISLATNLLNLELLQGSNLSNCLKTNIYIKNWCTILVSFGISTVIFCTFTVTVIFCSLFALLVRPFIASRL